MTTDIFLFPPDADATGWHAAIDRAFALVSSDRDEERRVYLDSFDWRLHAAGLVCELDGRRCRLVDLARDRTRARVRWTQMQPPRVPADLRAGRVRKILAQKLKLRALIPLVGARVQTRRYTLFDRKGRPVLHIHDATWQLENRRRTGTVRRQLALVPVRGHAAVRRRIASALGAFGLIPTTVDPLDWALAAAGLKPGATGSRITVKLDPGQSARDAVRTILRTLLTTMRQNEGGVKADIDTEFLHDYRVAIRRTRALLSQLADVFPAPVVREFKREFRALGRATGPLRDLDVHLLDEDRTRSRLPEALRAGLDPVYARLREQRQDELALLVNVLRSLEYRRLLQRWATVLHPPAGHDLPPTHHASRPIAEMARERIAHRYDCVRRQGSAVDATTSDAARHRLRIECKKLRYLLEFFSSLLPDDAVDPLVARLKAMQDNLGEDHDLVVQQATLREDLARLTLSSQLALQEAAALGGLATALADRQREVRAAFAGAFGAFVDDEARVLWARLLAAPDDPPALAAQPSAG